MTVTKGTITLLFIEGTKANLMNKNVILFLNTKYQRVIWIVSNMITLNLEQLLKRKLQCNRKHVKLNDNAANQIQINYENNFKI